MCAFRLFLLKSIILQLKTNVYILRTFHWQPLYFLKCLEIQTPFLLFHAQKKPSTISFYASIITADKFHPTAVLRKAGGKLYLSRMEWNFKRHSSPHPLGKDIVFDALSDADADDRMINPLIGCLVLTLSDGGEFSEDASQPCPPSNILRLIYSVFLDCVL